MTARNLSYTIAGLTGRPDLGDALRAAIRSNAHVFLNPPIANRGHRGIGKAARQVPRWLDRSSDPSHDLPLAAAPMERGGTGGALFRAMYRDFLAECATMVDDDNLRLGHQLYAEIAPLWTKVADHITAAATPCRSWPAFAPTDPTSIAPQPARTQRDPPPLAVTTSGRTSAQRARP